jgi:glycerophosphoryl diester phosphodiesterase
MRRSLYFLLCCLIGCSTPNQTEDMSTISLTDFDWQGHRGARGLIPENTVPSFLKALEYPAVSTLELDLAVSKDKQLIVSHEPWMSHHICSHPDGREVLKEEEDSLLIFQMTVDQIQQYDCGSRGNKRFPDQVAMKAIKPTFKEVVNAAEQYGQSNGRAPIQYNIEIKSEPSYDGIKTPVPEEFAQLVYNEIEALGITQRTCIQSFDVRPLQVLHAMDSTLITALLIDNPAGVKSNLNELGYLPSIYSPYFKTVTRNMVQEVHEKGMKIIPWTVNDTNSMKALITLGVDGIITDYPNYIASIISAQK